jgi:hypothetical protein
MVQPHSRGAVRHRPKRPLSSWLKECVGKDPDEGGVFYIHYTCCDVVLMCNIHTVEARVCVGWCGRCRAGAGVAQRVRHA